MEDAKSLLKKLSNLVDHDLDGLVEFYRNHSSSLANKSLRFTWQELVQMYRTQPNISDQEMLEMKGVSAIESSSIDFDSGLGSMESSSLIKSKTKGGGKKKKDGKLKASKKTKPEMIKEKTEPPPPLLLDRQIEKPIITKVFVEAKNDPIDGKRATPKDNGKLEIVEDKQKPNVEIKKSPEKVAKTDDRKYEDSDEPLEVDLIDDSYIRSDETDKSKRRKELLDQAEKVSKGKLSLLPNNSKGWEYYRKRSEIERDAAELKKLSLAEQHRSLVFTDMDESSIIKTEYEREYEKLRQQAEFEEDHDYEDFDFDKIEITSSLESLVEDDAVSEQRRTTPAVTSVRKRVEKSSRDILDGITKRVIMSQMTATRRRNDQVAGPDDDVSFRLNLWNSSNEKAHFIDTNSYYEPGWSNLKQPAFNQNSKRRIIEYNKLLECLIIRQLELHDHYEKLLPQPKSQRDEFVPIPFFTDFLVVHPYNKKNSYFYNPMVANFETELKTKNQTDELEPTPSFSLEGETARIEFLSNNNVFHGLRRRAKKKEHFVRQIDKARVGDFDLNHIYLINKLLISYGADNIREFYATLNTDLRFYLRRLHTRIPHKIIPLIWNDPVIQKLALILSSSYRLRAQKMKPENSKKNLVLPPVRKLGQDGGLKNVNKRLLVTNSLNFLSSKKNDKDGFDNLKFPKIGKPHPYSYELAKKNKYPYSLWPLFKQEDTSRNKVAKKKLYCHLMNSKHDSIRLQWRYMLQEDNMKKSNLTYLPPLSLKVNLNTH